MKKINALLMLLSLMAPGAFASSGIQNEDVKGASDITSANGIATGNLTMSGNCIASPVFSAGSLAALPASVYVYDVTNPSYIPALTTVAGVPGTCSAGQIELSQNATTAATGDTITFGGLTSQLIHISKFWDDFVGQLFSTTYANQFPSQTGNSGKFLSTNGTSASWLAGTYSPIAPVVHTYTHQGVTTTGTLATSTVCVNSVGTTVGVYPGMSAVDTTTTANLVNGTYVVNVPGTCSSGQIQLSATPAGNGTGDTLVFGRMLLATGTLSSSSACITSMGGTGSLGVTPGAPIFDVTNPTALTTQTVVAVPGTCSAGQVQMSANANTSQTGDTLNFGQNVIVPGSPLSLDVLLVGGGGSGGSRGVSNGNAGIGSWFDNSFESGPGLAGISTGNTSSVSGGACTGTLTSSISGFCIPGGAASASGAVDGTTSGGASCLGGNGGGASGTGSGSAGAPNSGSGGGGYNDNTGNPGGGGGSAGACWELFFTGTLSSSYPLYIGAGGSSVGNAGAGGDGFGRIIFKYQ